MDTRHPVHVSTLLLAYGIYGIGSRRRPRLRTDHEQPECQQDTYGTRYNAPSKWGTCRKHLQPEVVDEVTQRTTYTHGDS